MLRNRRRLAMGLQVVMAMFANAKGHANNSNGQATPVAQPEHKSIDQTAQYDFSKLLLAGNHPELLRDLDDRRRDVASMAEVTWKAATDAAHQIAGDQTSAASNVGFVPEPMSHEEARLWLQAFNAGPYALLKYKGDVPYRETQNYAPRVMKYYQMDLTNTPYEAYIKESAAKYGLDPQMIRAIMKTESDFNKDTVSHAGARGLMQVMPVVWSEIKKKYNLEWDYEKDVFDPKKNVDVACAYLAWLRYDFLPRHFAEFERHPEAPTILVRDHDRGVPDRPTPRIETAGMSADKKAAQAVQVASVAAPKAAAASATDAGSSKAQKPAEPAAAKPEIKISDAKPATTAKPREVVTKKPELKVEVADGKDAKVIERGGKTIVRVRSSGKSSETKKPAVADSRESSLASASSKTMKPNPRELKKPSVAKADSREEEQRS